MESRENLSFKIKRKEILFCTLFEAEEKKTIKNKRKRKNTNDTGKVKKARASQIEKMQMSFILNGDGGSEETETLIELEINEPITALVERPISVVSEIMISPISSPYENPYPARSLPGSPVFTFGE